MSKKLLRDQLIVKRCNLSTTESISKSEEIANKCIEFLSPKNIEALIGYTSFKNEVNLTKVYEWALINKIKLYFPKFLKDKYIIVNVTSLNELAIGKFGIMEPKSSKEKKKIYTNQIWLVPGLGFDKAGNRIGFGKGIYDQLLSKSNNYKIGIGYDIQLIKKVPIEKHDIKMNTIITNNGIITI